MRFIRGLGEGVESVLGIVSSLRHRYRRWECRTWDREKGKKIKKNFSVFFLHWLGREDASDCVRLRVLISGSNSLVNIRIGIMPKGIK